jgi:hypothetical protein
MPEHFPVFETHLRKRGRRWKWFLSTADGHMLMESSEGSRPAARYRANRALFQMLLGAAAGSAGFVIPVGGSVAWAAAVQIAERSQLNCGFYP